MRCRSALLRTTLLLGAFALVAASCGGDDDDATAPSASPSASDAPAATDAPATEAPGTEARGTEAPGTEAPASGEPVEIEWWHIQNNDPGLSLWQAVADEYMAEHPNVTIDITVYENEAFKTAIAPRLQAGDPPDLFQSWGGGGLREQVDAGLVRDISAEVEPWIGDLNEAAVGMYQVDGVQYGIPFDLGMVGFWYNKALFEQAGITAPPTTWEEFLEDVQMLKDAGITPLALGEGDKWPGMFWWAYLALRLGGAEAMEQAEVDGAWDAEPFVQAGAELQRLIEMDPFQSGFMAAVWDGAGGQAATIATEGAAMHLMGQWAPGTQNANSPDGEGLGDKLGWFPFPAVEGGAGDPTDAFGGGNGFAVGKDAPPEAVDFLQYATSIDVANRWGETNSGILPVTEGSDSSITDPNLTGVLEARANATFVQLYLDQATTPELGAVINDAVAELYAGQAAPEQVAQTIADAARA
jgi:raffinose/stachyose/melibiose transport system substrate-binding protein